MWEIFKEEFEMRLGLMFFFLVGIKFVFLGSFFMVVLIDKIVDFFN